MTADRAKLLERIRKLRALAGDRAATPAEAAAAADRIQALMREYGLDQVDVAAAEMVLEEVDLARVRSTDIDRLIQAIADGRWRSRPCISGRRRGHQVFAAG